VIDGATGAALQVLTGNSPWDLCVDPVLGCAYVAHYTGNNVVAITDAPSRDTRVRVTMNPMPGCTTSLARPDLGGSAFCRWEPYPSPMTAVLGCVGTAQRDWRFAAITYGQGSDSVTWRWNWPQDSLVLGENYLCWVPIEANAATTGNLGPGTSFVGNLAVYPLYRMECHVGAEGMTRSQAPMTRPPTIVRGVLFLPEASDLKPQASSRLLDISGRRVLDLHPGPNDVSRLASGVYFVTVSHAGDTVQVCKVVVER
jgi:hypothetical protein